MVRVHATSKLNYLTEVVDVTQCATTHVHVLLRFTCTMHLFVVCLDDNQLTA